MQSTSLRPEARLARSGPGSVIAIAVVCGVLLTNEISVADIAAYAAYFGLVIVAPGTIVWNWVMTRQERATHEDSSARTRLEDVICGACVGYAIELPSYAVARWLDVPRGYVVIEAAIVLCWAVATRPGQRTRRLGQRPGWGFPPDLALGGVIAYSAIWVGVTQFRAMPLTLEAIPDTDDPFQLALVGELRHHFPAVYPYVPDESLTYQYFYHLHAAASTWVTGLPSPAVFARLDPLMFLILAVTGAACVARRLSGRPWLGVLAAAILTLVGSFDVSGLFRGQANVEDRFLSSLSVHSPTQAMAFALVTPLVVLSLEMVRDKARLSRASWLTFFFLCVVMTGVKVTFVPMLLAGLAGTALLKRFSGRDAKTSAMAAGVCLVAVALCFAVLYRGQGRGLDWGPLSVTKHYAGFFQVGSSAWEAQLYVMVLLLVGVLVPVAGIVGLARAERRRDPRGWLLLIAAASGLAANALLAHPGLSQRFFLYSSSWLLAVASAWGVDALFPAGQPNSVYARSVGQSVSAGLVLFGVRLFAEPQTEIRTLPGGGTEVRAGLPAVLDFPVIVLVVIVYVGIAIVRRSRSAARVSPVRGLVVLLIGLGLARAIAFAVGDRPPSAVEIPGVPPTGAAAADWLREHSSPDDVVMTNVHCADTEYADEGKCDNRHFWMTALSERRFLIEGWGYTGRIAWSAFAPFDGDQKLLSTNDRLFVHPSAVELRRFADEYGVRWMLVDLNAPADLELLRSTRGVRAMLVNEQFAVLEIVSP